MYHYNLDSLIFRDRLAFGWGWFVDLEARVFPVRVVLQHADDSVSTILCLRSGTRTDVADAFPDVNHAAASGFMIQGRLDSDSPVSTARLVLAGVDGNVGGTEIELGALASMLQQDVRATVSRGIRILRRRSFSANLGIVAKRLRIHVREALAARRSISGRRNAILILDHDLGGGSNAFRRQMIGRLRQTSPVYLITPRVQTLDYYLTLYDGVVESGQVYERLADLLQFLDGESWASIVINELVSYPDPMAMVKWLSARASVVPASTDFVLYLHDFYSVCPQWTLVGRRGVYCGVPDFEECTRCIKSLSIPFLPYLSGVSIPDWRTEWEHLLRHCSIHAFSASTVEIFRKAFPHLHSKVIPVEPHSMEYFKGRPIDYGRNVSRYRVGIVGHINGPKGAAMVESAARIIEQRSLPIELVVFGSIDATGHYESIIQAGGFNADNLADKLEEYDINVSWVPSVCPETYSYVTSELIRLDIPLVCFDVGAPAERVSQYPLGHVVPDFDIAAVVDYFVRLREASLAAARPSILSHIDEAI